MICHGWRSSRAILLLGVGDADTVTARRARTVEESILKEELIIVRLGKRLKNDGKSRGGENKVLKGS